MTVPNGSRRDFVKKGVYVAPAILTLATAPEFAKAGSVKPDAPRGGGRHDNGPGPGPGRGDNRPGRGFGRERDDHPGHGGGGGSGGGGGGWLGNFLREMFGGRR